MSLVRLEPVRRGAKRDLSLLRILFNVLSHAAYLLSPSPFCIAILPYPLFLLRYHDEPPVSANSTQDKHPQFFYLSLNPLNISVKVLCEPERVKPAQFLHSKASSASLFRSFPPLLLLEITVSPHASYWWSMVWYAPSGSSIIRGASESRNHLLKRGWLLLWLLRDESIKRIHKAQRWHSKILFFFWNSSFLLWRLLLL